MEPRYSLMSAMESIGGDSSIYSSASIRVLVVPIGEVASSTFSHYLGLLRKCATAIHTSELTLSTSKRQGMHQHGQIFFNYVTQYNKAHQPLEEFQIHRQILLVIGIMHGPRCPVISEIFNKRFSSEVKKHPTALASRCFLFEPSEVQLDEAQNVKSLICIPNQSEEQVGGYIHTLIASVAYDLISALSTLVAIFEKRDTINSPPTNDKSSLFVEKEAGRQSQNGVNSYLDGQSNENNSGSVATLISTSTISSISADNLKEEFMEVVFRESIDKKKKPSKYFKGLIALPASRPQNIPKPVPRVEASNNEPVITSSTNNSNTLSGFSDLLREKKKVFGRALKLIADVQLLCGEWLAASSNYAASIEHSSVVSDYVWIAGAQEAHVCLDLLLAFANAEGSGNAAEITNLFESLSARFSSIVEYYELASSSYLRADVCLKISCFYTKAWCIANRKPVTSLDTFSEIEADQTTFQLSTTSSDWKRLITRSEVSTWISRIWESEIEFININDQIRLTVNMAYLFTCLGLNRKSAFFLRQSSLLLNSLLVENYENDTNNEMFDIFALMKTEQCQTATRSARVASSMYGASFTANTLVSISKKELKGKYSESMNSEKNYCGWNDLKVQVLKEGVTIAENIQDLKTHCWFLSVLLTQFHDVIAHHDLSRILQSLKKSLLKLTKQKSDGYRSQNGHDSDGSSKLSLRVLKSVNLIRKFQLLATSEDRRYVAPLVERSNSESKDSGTNPFIYNPYSSSKKEGANAVTSLAKGELSKFCIELVNPLNVDLEIESLSLITNGVALKSCRCEKDPKKKLLLRSQLRRKHKPTNVLLSLVPAEEGTLEIHGCSIHFTNFWKEVWFFGDNGEMTCSNEPVRPIVYHVHPSQPLLKLCSSESLDLTLFYGEQTLTTILLENVGNASMTFFSLRIEETRNNVKNKLDKEDTYDLNYLDQTSSAFTWFNKSEIMKNNSEAVPVGVGKIVTLSFNVFGKYLCTGCQLYIEYGASSSPNVMRKLRIPIKLTVHPVIQVVNFDIVPISHVNTEDYSDVNSSDRSLHNYEREAGWNDWCLAVVDVRNMWNNPFRVKLFGVAFDEHQLDPRFVAKFDLQKSKPVSPELIVDALQTKRLVTPIHKLFLERFIAHLNADLPGGFFIFDRIPNDLITDMTPIPTPKDANIYSHASDDGFVSVNDFVMKTQKLVREQQKNSKPWYLNAKTISELKYWQSSIRESNWKDEMKIASHLLWWYRGLQDEFAKETLEISDKILQIINYQERNSCLIESERWKRLLFLFKDQLFRRAIAGIEWTDVHQKGFRRTGRSLIRNTMKISRNMVVILRKCAVLAHPTIACLEPSVVLTSNGSNRWECLIDSLPKVFSVRIDFQRALSINSCISDRSFFLRLLTVEDASESEGHVAYDLKDQIMWSGNYEGVISLNSMSSRTCFSTDFHVLSTGTFKFIWHLEEVARVWTKDSHWLDRTTDIHWCPVIIELDIDLDSR